MPWATVGWGPWRTSCRACGQFLGHSGRENPAYPRPLDYGHHQGASLRRRAREGVETNLFIWLEQLETEADADATDALMRWADLEQRVHLEGSCYDVGFRILKTFRQQWGYLRGMS